MKREELIENYLVYTDNGIEKVHWCNVDGVKELVSPKGKVYGYVPDYFEVKRLQEQLKEANKLIKECKDKIEWNKVILTSFPPQEKIGDYLYSKVNDYLKKWGVK